MLKDINLCFYPGAKIGLVGLNGAGKSTLMRIMAGVDTEFTGIARPQPGSIKEASTEPVMYCSPYVTLYEYIWELGDPTPSSQVCLSGTSLKNPSSRARP